MWSHLPTGFSNFPVTIKQLLTHHTIIPFYLLCAYFSIIFLCCEGLRAIFNRIKTNRTRLMSNEGVSVFQVTAFAFGGVAVYNHYGPIGFFIATVLYMKLAQWTNGEATGNTLLLIGELREEGDRLEPNAFQAFSIQVIVTCLSPLGAYLAFEILQICYRLRIRPEYCLLKAIETPVPILYMCEFFTGFLFRIIMIYLDDPNQTQRKKWIPWVYATFFTAGQHFLGIHGLHPPIILSRLLLCGWEMGAEVVYFWWGLAYYVCLFGGWWAAAQLQKPTNMGSYWHQEKLWNKAEADRLRQLAVEEAESRRRGNRNLRKRRS